MTTTGLSTGRLGDPSAVRSLRMDDLVATYVVDGVLQMRASAFFPGNSGRLLVGATRPFHLGRHVAESAGGLLVERESTRLLIDAGVGRTTTDFAMADIYCGAMSDVLGLTGNRPEDIDVLAFTHLHFDHAGWAFAKGDKTFPNARYVVAAKEWAPYAEGTHRRASTTPWQVIEKMESNYTQLGLVDDGDAFHAPAQLAHPQWLSIADTDSAGAIQARRRLLAELAERQTMGFAFHFGDQAFGRTTTGEAGETNWDPVPTSILAPAPRPSR